MMDGLVDNPCHLRRWRWRWLISLYALALPRLIISCIARFKTLEWMHGSPCDHQGFSHLKISFRRDICWNQVRDDESDRASIMYTSPFLMLQLPAQNPSQRRGKKRLHLPAQKPNSRGSDPLALLGHAFCVHCIKSISSNHYVDLLFGFSLGPKLYFSSGNWCILIFYWNILLFFFFIQVTNSIFFLLDNTTKPCCAWMNNNSI